MNAIGKITREETGVNGGRERVVPLQPRAGDSRIPQCGIHVRNGLKHQEEFVVRSESKTGWQSKANMLPVTSNGVRAKGLIVSGQKALAFNSSLSSLVVILRSPIMSSCDRQDNAYLT